MFHRLPSTGRLAPLALFAALTMLCVGCQCCPPTVTTPDGDGPPKPENLPSYREVAEAYNARIAGVERLWARAVVELHWRDEQGDTHFEQGEGLLVMILPDKLAFTIGKLGNTIFWAGGDGQRHWLFDLRDDKVAFVGSVGDPDSQRVHHLPVAVRPQDLPRLMGLLPVPVDVPGAEAPVGFADGMYVLAPSGGGVKIFIDPDTGRPRRIERANESPAAGRVISRLSRPEAMSSESLPYDPLLATRYSIELPAADARMTLFLSDLTDEAGKFKPRAFDLDVLLRVHKPAKVIDLDAPPQRLD